MKKIGIIGYGNVGQAVAAGFGRTDKFELVIHDPEKNFDDFEAITGTDAVFICVPTEVNTANVDIAALDGSAIVEICTALADNQYKGVVCIKSTIPLEVLEQLNVLPLSLVINPEFLTERNAARDYIDSTQIVIGTTDENARQLMIEIFKHSYIRKHWFVHCSPAEAIVYKLFINTFLATKVSLFNEFREILGTVSSREWNDFVFDLVQDPRVGRTHTNSPGHDGQLGFGGKCLPACANYLTKYSRDHFLLSNTIEGSVATNNFLRVV